MLAELVLERIEMGILVLDSELRIVKCNPFLENMALKTQDEMLNRPVAEVFTRFAIPRYRQILRDCMEKGQVRFCSGMMHQSFVVPEGVPESAPCCQNLQVGRFEHDGRYFMLLQITDISDHFQRVYHLKHLIKDLGADYEQAKAAGELMRKQAYYDHLTGVYNRNFFVHQLRYDIKQAERTRHKVAILFMDLDGFKVVNDTYGHSIGDLLLQQVALRLKECVRITDTVARFGGDEFAVILTNIHRFEDGLAVARKICDSIQVPFVLGGNDVVISTSIGCSIYPDDSLETQVLLDFADRAMYQVKFGGKNNVMFYQG